MSGAALSAYRAAVAKSRDKNNKDLPQWMQEFRDRMPEIRDEDLPENKRVPSAAETRKEDFESSVKNPYDIISWYLYDKVVTTWWFEGFIMCNILLIGVATGLDLQFEGEYQGIANFVKFVSTFTIAVFTAECVLKLGSEGRHPIRYFTDANNGYFNTFDFAIVVCGYGLLFGRGDEQSVGALRMLRLVRLLSFIKGVPQLRVIVAGLIQGMKSVSYICMLLLLVIYICAILTCLFFGRNDPARFGSVAKSMLTLFQVSTMASWTATAYTTFFGCSNYLGAPYGGTGGDNPFMVHTSWGSFEGFRCPEKDEPEAFVAFFFFQLYIVLTAWVIMSLFIGVITMGMFESFEAMKEEQKHQRYMEKLAENNDVNSPRYKRFVELIHDAIMDVEEEEVVKSDLVVKFEAASKWCKHNRDKPWFNNTVTVSILIVGVMIGIETDTHMSCARYAARDDRPEKHPRCEPSVASTAIAVSAQIIFTLEMGVKVVAERYTPQRYLDDPWNCMDAFVVITGFIEMSPLRFIFAAFPVVILRLLRLLRVFRLAKALPRLRSIVEALIQGFGAVGWICVFILVFNYIIACMFMIFLKPNDPFHFGTLPFAMFNVLRISTLDSWDQMLGITMFGCDQYPQGFDFTVKESGGRCDEPEGLGWMGGILMLIVVIFDSFILPTVLIGIVAISFDEATRRAANYKVMLEKMDVVIKDANEKMPGYFNETKMAKIKQVFEEMDVDGGLALDMDEMCPFYQESFKLLFNVNLKKKQMEGLFHLIDADGSGESGFAEFVMFVVVVKQIEAKTKVDPTYARRTFDPAYHHMVTHFEEQEDANAPANSSAPLTDVVKVFAGSEGETKERPKTPPRAPPPQAKPKPSEEVRDRPKTPPRRPRPPGGAGGPGATPSTAMTTTDAHHPASPVDPYPDEGIDPSLVELVRSRCAAIANKFLPAGRSEGEHQALSQRLFKRFTSELLLAQSVMTEQGSGGAAAQAEELSTLTQPQNPIHVTGSFDRSQQQWPQRVPPSQFPNQLGPTKPDHSVWQSVIEHLEGSLEIAVMVEEAFESSNDPEGMLSIVALSKLLASNGLPLHGRELAAFQESLDEGRTGKVSFEQFFLQVQKNKELLPHSTPGHPALKSLVEVWAAVIELLESEPRAAVRIEESFERANSSSDGFLDLEELFQVLTSYNIKLGPDDLNTLRDSLDTNKSGQISLEQFLAAVQSNKALLAAHETTKPSISSRSTRSGLPLNQIWAVLIELLESKPEVAIQVEEAFERANENTDGAVAVQDLVALFSSHSVKLSADDLGVLSSDLDPSRIGKITLDQFLYAVKHNKGLSLESGASIPGSVSTSERSTSANDSVRIWSQVFELLESEPESASRVEEAFDNTAGGAHDGLDIEVLVKVLTSFDIKLQHDDLAKLRRDLDVNSNGRVSLQDFLRTVQAKKEMLASS